MRNGITQVSRRVIHTGIEIKVDKKKYLLSYPTAIWEAFPHEYRLTFADSLAYLLTMHLVLEKKKKLIYGFPPPVTEPFFFKGMIYSLPETTLTEGNGTTMSGLLKLLYNANLNIEFTGRPRSSRFKNINRNNHKRAIIPFSFGKDSLLTFALCSDLGIAPYPIFFREPRSPFENRHKYRLAKRFLDEFGVNINVFPVKPGWLRQVTGKWWGWDLLLTQYTLLILPFLFGTRSKYLFWAHEQSCNEYFYDQEGYLVNPVYEQSFKWLLASNATARVLGCNSVFSSLIEPIHEMAITKILHSRYPSVAKYQMSCFADEKEAENKRWCGVCSKCARMYIFFRALGISPHRVGFRENMLSNKKRALFPIFSGNGIIEDSAFSQTQAAKEEQSLAFYLAYKRGVRGGLMEEFKKRLLAGVTRKESYLRKKFFGIHSTNTLPYELKSRILKIYQEELRGLS